MPVLPKKHITFGLLAHVDAGKTTLSEALLYAAGKLKKLGRVDHRDCFLDNFDQERERGITIFSKQALFHHGDTDFTLLDTPGHADFSAEMERCLQVMDYAVLVISGTDGVQAHTDTLWSLLEKYRIPTFLFITKMDVANMSRAELMKDLQLHLSEACTDFSSETDPETLAMLDEDVLERYMDTGTVAEDDICRLISGRKLFPCFFGSGLKTNGVIDFLDALDQYTVPEKYPDAFGAKVFKISRDPKGKRLTWLKITGGSLSTRTSIRYLPLSAENALEEKIHEIRLYSGQKYDTAEAAEAGTVCALLGLTGTYPGQGLGIEPDSEAPLLEPVLAYRVILPSGTDARTMLPKLKLLEEEDPQLHIVWEERLGEIQIQLMGAVQIEVIKALIKERFDTDVRIDTGHIIYRETIRSTVEGIGHYEPLKHYAEVHLILEPGERGSGLVFDTACSTDDLDLNWQRLILTHLEEKRHAGVLTGSPITDMKITLAAGKAHLKHTEGGDFRQATYRAVRQGLMKAENVLLEPIFEFRLEVPADNIGRAISDIHAMDGEHSSPLSAGDRMMITGTAPAAAMADYMTEVMAYTGGRGKFSCHPAGYRPCSNPLPVLEAVCYDPEADLENTPDSVFCAHGAGFNVKWNQVEEYMHLDSVLPGTGKHDPSTGAKNASVQNLSASRSSPSPKSIDEKELEAIMEREFGPIRRKVYSEAKINAAPGKKIAAPKKERLIIDGYNLLFAWDEYKKLAADNIDLARERLIDVIVNFSSFRRIETVLVFDAYKVPGGRGERYDKSGLHIAYTCENESADLFIERLTDEIGKNENVRVVTSDSLIRLTALRSGVMRTSSADFITEVKDTLAEMRKLISG